MSSEKYTPNLSAFRGVYGAMLADWCRDDALAEFDRMIAKIKADALREAADSVRDMDPRATPRGVAAALRVEADRIENGDNNE